MLFPDDLIRAQQEWYDIYRALAGPRPRRVTELRRRLHRLSVQIYWHPFWSTTGGVAADRVELKRRAGGGRRADVA